MGSPRFGRVCEGIYCVPHNTRLHLTIASVTLRAGARTAPSAPAAEAHVRITEGGIRLRVLLLVFAVLAVPQGAAAQGSDWEYVDPVPGNLVLGYHQTWYWPPSIYMCPSDFGVGVGEFWVWGIAPEVPVSGVRFNVVASTDLVGGGVVLEGAADVGLPDDDDWDLDFGSCLQWPAGTPVKLVHYALLIYSGFSEPFWICLSSPENIQVEWTTCDGGTISGGVYPPDNFAYPVGRSEEHTSELQSH